MFGVGARHYGSVNSFNGLVFEHHVRRLEEARQQFAFSLGAQCAFKAHTGTGPVNAGFWDTFAESLGYKRDDFLFENYEGRDVLFVVTSAAAVYLQALLAKPTHQWPVSARGFARTPSRFSMLPLTISGVGIAYHAAQEVRGN